MDLTTPMYAWRASTPFWPALLLAVAFVLAHLAAAALWSRGGAFTRDGAAYSVGCTTLVMLVASAVGVAQIAAAATGACLDDHSPAAGFAWLIVILDLVFVWLGGVALVGAVAMWRGDEDTPSPALGLAIFGVAGLLCLPAVVQPLVLLTETVPTPSTPWVLRVHRGHPVTAPPAVAASEADLGWGPAWWPDRAAGEYDQTLVARSSGWFLGVQSDIELKVGDERGEVAFPLHVGDRWVYVDRARAVPEVRFAWEPPLVGTTVIEVTGAHEALGARRFTLSFRHHDDVQLLDVCAWNGTVYLDCADHALLAWTEEAVPACSPTFAGRCGCQATRGPALAPPGILGCGNHNSPRWTGGGGGGGPRIADILPRPLGDVATTVGEIFGFGGSGGGSSSEDAGPDFGLVGFQMGPADAPHVDPDWMYTPADRLVTALRTVDAATDTTAAIRDLQGPFTPDDLAVLARRVPNDSDRAEVLVNLGAPGADWETVVRALLPADLAEQTVARRR